MAEERVENQRPRLVDEDVHVADHEQRPDLAPLSSLARELDSEVDDLLERAPTLLGATGRLADRAEGGIQHFGPTVQVHVLFNEETV